LNFESEDVDPAFLIRRTVEGNAFGPKDLRKERGTNPMKYMLLIYDEEQVWGKLSETEQEKIYGEYRRFTQEITSSGHYMAGSQLHPTSAATSVRIKDGKMVTTDGPFAETKEQLGGYYLIEAKHLDEAIGIAARIPSARMGTIEVRPLA
jgi:hypothetical protein